MSKRVRVRMTFLEEALGTTPGDPHIHEEYIASKAPDDLMRDEEMAGITPEDMLEKSRTVFPKDNNGNPYFWDYQIKGFMKDTCGALQKCKGEDISKESNKLKAYKKVIDGCIFVSPRKIPIKLSGEMGDCQRPLRAQTAQGERIALANSETVPAGSSLECVITCLSDAHYAAVIEWLGYGRFRGLSQWRNSGKGRFTYEILEETDGILK